MNNIPAKLIKVYIIKKKYIYIHYNTQTDLMEAIKALRDEISLKRKKQRKERRMQYGR